MRVDSRELSRWRAWRSRGGFGVRAEVEIGASGVGFPASVGVVTGWDEVGGVGRGRECAGLGGHAQTR